MPEGDAVRAPTPLAGLRVVELAGYVAAPLAGLVLAQLGAEVIRVDPPGGAPDRGRWPLAESGESLYWAGLNGGKLSVELDLREAADHDLLVELVAGDAGGGIFLTNSPSPTVPQYSELAARRPDVIRLQLTGHPDGSSAVDYTVNAASGFAAATGPADHGEPINHVLPAWDVCCGLYVAVGLLAAERDRQRTGHGADVRISLSDVALATASNLGFLAEAELTGAPRPKIGNAVFGTYIHWFTTRDAQRIIVVALTERHWLELMALTGSTEPVLALQQALGCDFTREADRYRRRALVDALLEPWFASHSATETADALRATSVPWSQFATFHDVVATPSGVERNPIVNRIESPGIDAHYAAGSPLVFNGAAAPARPAPGLGAHAQHVLSRCAPPIPNRSR